MCLFGQLYFSSVEFYAGKLLTFVLVVNLPGGIKST
jgi:hypothetical protein